MAFEPHPWFIGLEGVEHSAEVARMLAWSATNGASGIITPKDLKVVAQSVPSDSVVIRPGGFVVESKFSGASQQSYVERAPTSTTLEVPATGSSGGATRYVVARITDPDYPGGGTIPPVPNDGAYSAPYLVSSLSSSRTEIPLAKITQPANTAAITNAMITDLREVANPRTVTVPRARPNVAQTTETLTVTATKGEWFPNAGAEQTISIPSWATKAVVEAEWIQVREPGGNSYGKVWVEFGPWAASGEREYSTQTFDWNTHGGSDVARGFWKVADYVTIPASIRGTDQIFVMKGRLDGASSNAARPQIDAASGVLMKVTFQEVADPSDS